jgi:16S rRNA (uracil1498-N3)-methyltransferase
LQGALEGTTAPLATVATALLQSGQHKIAILVGPEGDFTPAEYALASKIGCRAVSFGSLTLRAETAIIYALSVLQALWEAEGNC